MKSNDEKKDEMYKSASFAEMLRYMDTKDTFLLIGGLLGSLASGILNPLVPLIMSKVNTVLIAAQNSISDGTVDWDELTRSITLYAIELAAVGVGMALVAYFSMVCFYCLCERQVHTIRKKFLFAVLNQDMEWFDVNEVGALTQKMSSGIDRIKDGMSDKIGVVIHALASLICGVTVAFTMNWKMTLIMLALAPTVTLSLFVSARFLRKAVRIQMDAYSAAGALANEVLNGVRTVLSFNAQDFEIARYKAYLKTARQLGIRKAKLTGAFTGTFVFLMNITMALGFYFGTIFVFSGEMQTGEVFGVFWSIMLGAMRLGMAAPNLNAIVSAKLAAGEIFSIIDKKPHIDCASKNGRRPRTIKGDITFEDLHFSYPTRPTVKILNGVSLNVKAGQKVAFVGHSGCGKSTTIGLLMRFYEANSGFITIDGVPLQDLNISWLRETIGIVSQEPVLFAASVEDNLCMGHDIPKSKLMEACKLSNALDFIEKLPNGFDTIVGDGGVRLSGGQKQRLAIARALARDPKVLLLDEATSALDSESEHLVQEALDQAAEGRTTISIAHRLSTIRNSDAIYVFEKGQIVEFGDHETLLAKDGTYAALVASQALEAQNEDTDFTVESADVKLNEDTLSKVEFTQSEARESARRARASTRMSKSMTNTNAEWDVEDVEEEVQEIGASKASTLNVLRYAKPELGYVITGVIGSILAGIRYPMYSVLMGQLFLALSMNGSSEAYTKLWIVCGGFVFFAVVSWIGAFSSGVMLGNAGERMSSRLRVAVFRNILRQDGYYFDRATHSVGKLTARLASDAYNVQAAVDQRLSEVISGVTSLAGGLVVAFVAGPTIAPICLVTALVLVVFQLGMNSYLKRRGTKDIETAEEASRIASEAIENVKTVQSLASQKALYENFCEASTVPHKRAIVRGLFQSMIYALGISFTGFNFGVSYGCGVYVMKLTSVTPQTLFQVIEALNIAAIVMVTTSSYFPEYLKARLSAGIMFQMMNEAPRIDGLSPGGLKPELNGAIDAQKLRFAYPNRGRQLALDSLTIKADAGATIALVGPSGCGKSTIIQLLERFYDVLDGTLTIDGCDIRQLNVPFLRSLSAVVGQEPTLFNLSIRDNIAYGMSDVPDEQVIAAATLANIHEFIKSLPDGYKTTVGSKGTQLSGGQRQRIAIARAIIRDPKILLLDEATSALDTESERIVQDALERASQGRTCIIVAHRLSTIQHADLIVVIREGRVIEQGTHQQLLIHKGMYYRMVQKQN
uniref:ABC-type xenobiotic transporter n=1 Tax=Panagrellus redivivus TaxID=6233 RepID=A0A7E4VAL1_PANRE